VGYSEVIAVIGAVQGLFISLVLFFLGNGRKTANRLLALLIVAISFTISRPVVRGAYDFFLLFMLLFGPLFLLYVRVLTGELRVPGKKDLVHSVPFIAVVLIYLVQIFTGNDFLYRYVYQPAFMLKNIHPLVYSVYILFYMRRYRNSLKDRYSNIEKVSLSWITVILSLFVVYFLIISPLMFVFYMAGADYIMHLESVWTPVFIAVYIFILGFNGIRHHEVFISKPEPDREKDAGYSGKAAQKLKNFMDEHHPYLAEDLTLEGLSGMTEIPEHQLSKIINKEFGMNFFDFINSYRIDYFNLLCLAPENRDRSILELAFDSGFYSKSTFNLSYKKRMGITPSQFIKSNS